MAPAENSIKYKKIMTEIMKPNMPVNITFPLFSYLASVAAADEV